MVNKQDAISVERVPLKRDSNKTRAIYVLKCRHDGCERTIRVRHDSLKSATGKCKQHAKALLKPFISKYKTLLKKAKYRGLEVTLTYDEYMEFTTQPNCAYCGESIPWVAHRRFDEKHAGAVFLDRVDNSRGYSADNCVVCCADCNWFRMDNLTHKEMLYIMPLLKEFRRNETYSIVHQVG